MRLLYVFCCLLSVFVAVATPILAEFLSKEGPEFLRCTIVEGEIRWPPGLIISTVLTSILSLLSSIIFFLEAFSCKGRGE